ncbi:MAG: 23S rRNA (pseudouridine(1915)-N(3))-methyltransferase RlmH [Candidatus Zixiibacteriota bacterium]
MIKIKIVVIGKDKDKWLSDGCAHYIKLLSRFAKAELKIIPALKSSASLSPLEIKKKEGLLIKKEFDKDSYIALSDKGQQHDSLSFANWLEKQQIHCKGSMAFIIGGAYGLADDILKKANHVISLSPLTFSHQLVRLVLLEQLYRAFSIIHGTDYHK